MAFIKKEDTQAKYVEIGEIDDFYYAMDPADPEDIKEQYEVRKVSISVITGVSAASKGRVVLLFDEQMFFLSDLQEVLDAAGVKRKGEQ